MTGTRVLIQLLLAVRLLVAYVSPTSTTIDDVTADIRSICNDNPYADSSAACCQADDTIACFEAFTQYEQDYAAGLVALRLRDHHRHRCAGVQGGKGSRTRIGAISGDDGSCEGIEPILLVDESKILPALYLILAASAGFG